MKTNKLLILLATVSICFNVFFAAGFLFARRTLNSLKTPEGRVELVISKLKLDPRQSREVHRRLDDFRRQGAIIRQFSQADADLFWGEIVKENPDQAKIQKILDRTAGTVQEYRSKSVELLQDVLKVLDEKQKEQLVEMIKDKQFFGK